MGEGCQRTEKGTRQRGARERESSPLFLPHPPPHPLRRTTTYSEYEDDLADSRQRALYTGLIFLFIFLLPCARLVYLAATARNRQAQAQAQTQVQVTANLGGRSARTGPPRTPQEEQRAELMRNLARTQLLTQRLMMTDRDFTDADYDMLIALDRLGPHTHAPTSGGGGSAASVRVVLESINHGPYAGGAVEDEDDAPNCVICMDDLEERQDVATLSCAHQFHWPCLSKWVSTAGVEAACPICKHPILRT